MPTGFNLKYGVGYEQLPHWNQFVQLLDSAKGRKNLFIFRVLTAHIAEMGLDDADGFQMLSAIEGWANDRLSSKGFVQKKNLIPEKSPPQLPIEPASVISEPQKTIADSNIAVSDSSSSPDGEAAPIRNALPYGMDVSLFSTFKNKL